MTEFCFEPGLTERDIAEALGELAPGLPSDAPVVAAWGDAPGRAIFASRTMLRLFGASTLDELSERLFAGADPGAERLAALVENEALDGAPRIEKLRFLLGPGTRSLSFLCRRLAREGGASLFIAAALDGPAGAGGPDHAVPAPVPPPVPPPGQSAAPALSQSAAPARKSAGETAAEPLSEGGDADPIRAGLTRPGNGSGAIRFLWRADAEDRIIELTAEFAETVGAGAADLVGRSLAEAARGLDGGRRLAELMARREAWSGVEILWPIEGAAAAVPICFGAAPRFDRHRRFSGYRGFGVIYVARLAAMARGGLISAPDKGLDRSMSPHGEPRSAVAPSQAANVIVLRPLAPGQNPASAGSAEPAMEVAAAPRELTRDEQKAFDAIAFSLGARLAELVGGAPRNSLRPPADVESGPAREPPAADIPEVADRAGFFDGLSMGVFVCRGRSAVFANRHLLDLVGYADLDAAVAAGAFAPIIEILRGPARQGETLELRGGSASPILLRARAETIEWGGREATLVSLMDCAAADFAGRDAELRRYRNEARELAAVLDTVMDGVLMLDSSGRILALNRSGEALFGYDKSEVAGKPFTMLIAAESRARAEDYFEGVKSNGVASLLNDGREIVGLARQGGAIPMFMTLGRIGAAASSAESEQEVGFCALLRDITHWKKIERELDEARREAERASALKSDFLAKVSHEIRTPLNAIMGFAEVIMEERFGPIGNERYKEYLKDIHSSGALVMSLVNDLLDLSKIEAGKMELEFAAVDANRVISQCVSIMQPQASRARVVIRLALAAGLPNLLADERSLRQIVLNLLSNAVKFNQPGGQVIVATALADSGHVALRIRDTGVGMSEADIEIALEPFRQLAVSRLPGGTGLGLPLTKALVEANHAFFSIKSKKQEGTLVEVAFPVARI